MVIDGGIYKYNEVLSKYNIIHNRVLYDYVGSGYLHATVCCDCLLVVVSSCRLIGVCPPALVCGVVLVCSAILVY